MTGNVTAPPTGDAPAVPTATNGVTSTVRGSCAPTGNASERYERRYEEDDYGRVPDAGLGPKDRAELKHLIES